MENFIDTGEPYPFYAEAARIAGRHERLIEDCTQGFFGAFELFLDSLSGADEAIIAALRGDMRTAFGDLAAAVAVTGEILGVIPKSGDAEIAE